MRAAAKGVLVSGHLCAQPYGVFSRMTTNFNSGDELDAIFKQKKALRTQVRKTLKAIDPSLRSQQGTAIQSNSNLLLLLFVLIPLFLVQTMLFRT